MKFEELLSADAYSPVFTREGRRIRGEVFARIGRSSTGSIMKFFLFPLTGAQKRVLREIRETCGPDGR